MGRHNSLPQHVLYKIAIIDFLQNSNLQKGFFMKYFLYTFTLFSFLGCSKTTPIPQDTKITYTTSMNSAYVKSLDFRGKEIISIKSHGKFYYINKSGKTMPTLTYDGKADEFSDGLARTKFNGKVGFFNKNLEMVLKPIYDFAFPFHNGKAEICIGCQEKDANGTPMLDGRK